ncbi:MAG: NAD(+) synthase [Christensenellales bacterium]
MTDSLRVMACDLAFGAPGDVHTNTRAILERVEQARGRGMKVLLLPELCLSGECGDMFRQQVLLDACREGAQEIARASGSLLAVFGVPLLQAAPGGRLYNALAVACDGRLLGFVVKADLPKTQKAIFDADCPEKVCWQDRTLPVFRDGLVPLRALGLPGTALVGFGDERWPLNPQEGLHRHEAVLLAFGRPAAAGRIYPVFPLEEGWFARIGCLAYANAGAAQSTTDRVYPGDAAVFVNGCLRDYAPAFSSGAASIYPGTKHTAHPYRSFYGEPDPRMPYAPLQADVRASWCRDCLEIAARGLAARMRRIGSKVLTLGVSGGLDSAMALLTAKRAIDILGLPLEAIYAYSLPALGSSQRTRDNAVRLMAALGLPAREIDLCASVRQHFRDIGQDERVHDAAYENAQARERTQVLMDLANRLGGLMVGSGDLSELALGFTTFGGDHMSMYGVNAGLYKTAIRLILRRYAQDTDSPLLRDTLRDILNTPVSPELVPARDGRITQKTEDILGPYELNDFFLHALLGMNRSPGQTLEDALTAFAGEYSRKDLLERLRAFYRRFFRNQFKRNCLPDGPAVLGVSLSPRGGFSLPSDFSAGLWLKELDRLDQKG